MPRWFTAAVAVLGLWSTPLLAQCTGDSLLDRLSEADRAEIAAAVAETPFAEGLFWRATKQGREIRLVGTMHVHDPRHDSLMPRVETLLVGVERVFLELTPKEEAEVQSAMLADPARLFITDGPTLPDLLDEDTWRALAEAARARQIPPFTAAKFRPWYLSMSLAMPTCAMPDLLAGRRGLDHRIIGLAEARGLPMQALEPWDTLFALMESGTEAEQLEMLRLSIVPEDLQAEMIVALLDGYFAESVAQVWEVSRVGARLVPGMDPDEAEAVFTEMQTSLLDTRNRNWMGVITEGTAAHDVILVAVGAAHLPGEAGLLSLLQAEGWTVSRVLE